MTLKSPQTLILPLLLGTITRGLAHSLLSVSLVMPSFCFRSSSASKAGCKAYGTERLFLKIGFVSSFSLIVAVYPFIHPTSCLKISVNLLTIPAVLLRTWYNIAQSSLIAVS